MLLRRIARPLFASWFVAEGVSAATRPAEHVTLVRQTLDTLGSYVPSFPTQVVERITDDQLTLAVRVHGAATALAGLSLSLGRAPRTSALTLALLTAPTVLTALPLPAGASGAQQARLRRAKVLARVSSTGGALLAAADTAGRPSLAWRAANARELRAAARADATEATR